MANLTPRGTRLIGDVADQKKRKEYLDLLELLDERARRSFEHFVRATVGHEYKMGWVHREICEELERFLADVIAGKSPRLMLFMPPRHGKTELASRRFPAYALGRHPDLSIIATSYGSELASSNNRDVQRVMDSDAYRDIFPGSQLWGSNIRTVADGSYLRNSDIFEIVGHRGVYKSSGVGGGITGRGMDIGIIDDPIKDAEEAYSKTYRDKVWEWYTSTFYTRLMPGGGILIILTRWHEDDVAGRVLQSAKETGEQWRIIRYPAIAEEDEAHRQKGEALHAERYPIDQLLKIQKAVGSRVWTSLFQQRPAAAEGVIFKREDWNYLKPPMPLSDMTLADRKLWFRHEGIERVIQNWDIAVGGKEQSDYSACTTLGIGPSRFVVLEVWKKQLDYPGVRAQVQNLYAKWNPSKVGIEGGGSTGGKAIVQELKKDTRIPLFETITSKDKVLRANLVSPQQEAGHCYLVAGEPWVADFVESVSSFPNAPHDDDVDSFVMAMEEATSGRAPMRISKEFLEMLG